MAYTLLKWNSEYGEKAKFIARDDQNGQQSVFIPGRTSDLVWTTSRLDQAPEIDGWESFKEEKVENLDDVAM